VTSAGPYAAQTPADAGLVPAMQAFLAVVLVALGVLLLVVVTHRLTASLFAGRRDRLVQRTRPLLLEVLADEDPEPEALARLAALPDRQWRLLEPTVVGMLGKVRGAARGSLAEVLTGRGTLARAVRATRSRSWARRCRAAEMLGAARRREHLPELLPLLADRNREVRQVAARAAGRIGAAGAAEALLSAAVGPRALPARDVAAALVLLEPTATPVIVDAASRAREPQVRSVAAEVLGLRGAVESADLLVRMLERDREAEVRIRSARALGRIGVRAATRPLVRALASDVPELRAVAARALGQVGGENAAGPLAGALGDSWHRVASNAAEALVALGPPGTEALEEVARSTVALNQAAGYARQALALHRVTGERSPALRG
jgi:HEAT repeat protein